MRNDCDQWNDVPNTSTYYYICEWDSYEEYVAQFGEHNMVDMLPTYDYVEGVQSETEATEKDERYIRGETNLKYILDGVMVKFESSVGRIDTSNITQDDEIITGVHLKNISGTSMYQKVEVPVVVDLEEAKELCIYTKPSASSYHIGSKDIDVTGLNLVVLYDNGKTIFLNEGDYETEFDFTTANSESPVTFTANIDGQALATECTVVVTDHEWDNGEVTTNPTHTTKGEKTYTCTIENCSATRTEPIDKNPEHKYSDNWTKYSDTQHVRACACGEKEYANHTWDSGVVTDPATYSKEGTKTYTCSACSATKTEIIPKIGVLGTDPQIKISNKMAHAGETVKLDITMKNVVDIKSITLSEFVYDNTKLELVNLDWKLSNAALFGWDAKEEKAVLTFNQNTNANGVIATLTFKALDDAELGEVAVSCQVAAYQKLDEGGESPVTVYTVDGGVTITNIKPGDMNDDNFVDSDDAIYLLYHIYFSDSYEANQNCDFDGNGNVNSDDAVYLLYHIYFGESYPLGG